ncbi:sulfotransferase domain-containing protein [Nisaea acidiphila]|uniref:Sulfotransferase domain-containing protein n=1 Tax=Nisaea acidiphila TaxID=1862145 RepID=A0A9J7ARD0_9PROT|nr:sulfotransferase domain-containing protein [Nisaea acidiphila]UUX49928.1 sulfotransferase domain-containing protein [Nisaea acidiphila]
MPKIIWLASYPKSGNTWMRAFLANYLLNTAEPVPIGDLRAFSLSDVRPRFYDEVFEGDVRKMTAEQSVRLRPDAQRCLAEAREHDHFVKTHSRQGMLNGTPLIERSVSAGAIYIVRNPFDIVPSYASHLGVEPDQAIDVMADPDHATVEADVQIMTALGRWDAHVESWMDDQSTLPVCLVRYEDLRAVPEQAFGRVIQTLGLPFDTNRLARAIRHCSFEELSRQEEEGGFSERPPHMERFFRAGRSGEGAEELSSLQRQRLVSEFGAVMRKLGYLER